MGGTGNMESHLSSAASFVEGGIQDACDDACSICLEAFIDSDPSTVTSCKHEFHLQCILEWCQRSAQCPMCWQAISLKDPTSQELLEAVEGERSIRSNQTRMSRNTSIFHHPALVDFDLQHLPVGVNDAELEERIMQHLAAAAAVGRAHHLVRREAQRGGDAAYQIPDMVPGHANQSTVLSPGTSVTSANRPGLANNRSSAGQSTPVGQDGAGPSDFQAFSETLKSRLGAVSTRYKESITKSTRGWKERLFSRNTSMADIGSEVRREVSAGIAAVSRMMDRLDTRESRMTAGSSAQHSASTFVVPSAANEMVTEDTTASATYAATSSI